MTNIISKQYLNTTETRKAIDWEKICEDIKEKLGESDPDFLVMEESDMRKDQGLKSTIKIDCEKCHNQEGVWWSLQTRSADEPETRFYRCVKCNHTWRDYT